VDALGNPIHVHITPGNTHDISEAPKLIEKAKGENFIADKGYDSDNVVDALKAKGINPVVAQKSNRKVKRDIDSNLYKERHLVENFFCKIKRFRRIATRYDKNAINFLGCILFASIRIWLA
jgi:putative transposase